MEQQCNIIQTLLPKIITNDTVLVVMAGSRITDFFAHHSDYDFFVITESTSKVVMYKINTIRVECFYYSLTRLDNCLKANDHIIVDVLANGEPYYKKGEKAEKILVQMKKIHNYYQIQSNTLLKFQYRFQMIEEKLILLEDDSVIRWLNIFALPYILRFLFYFNHCVCPTTKKWPINILKLPNLPDKFDEKLEVMLGKKPMNAQELKTILLEVLSFIKEKIGTPPDYYEIPMAENDITTLI